MSHSEAPLPKEGWLRKLARSGLVKNWQNRYFLLENGKISYYQQQLHAFPYSDNLKGELFLAGAKMSTDKKKYSDKQVYIVGGGGQKDLLIEAESAAEAQAWAEAVAQHIEYAPRAAAPTSAPRNTSVNSTGEGGSFEGVEEGKSNKVANESDPNAPETQRDSNDDTAVSGSANSVTITPKPAWVIKVLRTNGEKIFINLCEHAEVPMIPLVLSIGYNKWPLMVLTPPRTLKDEKGDEGGVEVTIYDAIVNPAVVSICLKDTQAKDATCARVMRLLKKNYGEDLQSEFRLPKITKKYKGEVTSVQLPANISTLARKRTSIFASFANNQRQGSFLRSNSQLVPDNVLNNRSPFSGEAGTAAGEVQGEGGSPVKWLDRNDSYLSQPSISNFYRADSVNNNTSSNTSNNENAMTVSPLHAAAVAKGQKPARSYSATPFSQNTNNNKQQNLQQQQQQLLNDPSFQSMSESERRTTLARLFPSADDNTVQARNNNSGNFSPVNISNQPVVSRTHTDMNYDSAALARAGNVRKSVRSSLINPLVDKNQLLSQVDESLRKLVIPFQIIRSNGTVARQQPDKLSSGKVLGYGVKVFVVAKKINYQEGVVWFKTTEGWIMDKYSPANTTSGRSISANSTPKNTGNNNTSGRTIVPTLYGSAVNARIVSTRFEALGSQVNANGPVTRVSTSGWNMFRPSAIREGFQTRFVIEIMQMDNAMLRISRTFGEIIALQQALLSFPNKAVKDRALKAGSFPLDDDNDPELVDDVHLLLELIESVESWLNKLIALQVERTKCKAFTEFLMPREKPDYELMELELMAKDGLGGAWGDE